MCDDVGRASFHHVARGEVERQVVEFTRHVTAVAAISKRVLAQENGALRGVVQFDVLVVGAALGHFREEQTALATFVDTAAVVDGRQIVVVGRSLDGTTVQLRIHRVAQLHLERTKGVIQRAGDLQLVVGSHHTCVNRIVACVVHSEVSRTVREGPFAKPEVRVGHRSSHLNQHPFPSLRVGVQRGKHLWGGEVVALAGDDHRRVSDLGFAEVLDHCTCRLDGVTHHHGHVRGVEPHAAVGTLAVLDAHVASEHACDNA